MLDREIEARKLSVSSKIISNCTPKNSSSTPSKQFDTNSSPSKSPKQSQLHGVISEPSDRIDLRTECIFSTAGRIPTASTSHTSGVNLEVHSLHEALEAISAARKRVTPSDNFTGITAR